jgi:hypothetical protein
MKHCFLIIIGLMYTTLCFGQQTKMKVVIQSSIAKNVPEENRDALGELMMMSLSEGLTNTGKYTVLESRDIIAQKQAEEAGFQLSGMTDDESLTKIGKLMNAAYSCYAQIAFIAGNYRILCKMTDLETGEIIGNFSATTQNGDKDILGKCDEIVQQIISKKSLSQKVNNDISCPQCCWNGSKFVEGVVSISDEKASTWDDAMSICQQKGEGWYLPSKEELSQIYKNRSEITKNGAKPFALQKYWTSSRDSRYDSFYMDFQNGKVDYNSNNTDYPCRCIKKQE